MIDGLVAAQVVLFEVGLESTVRRFNSFAARGVDEDFGRGTYPWAAMMTGDRTKPGNPNLGPVEKPPFYGLQLRVVSAGVNRVREDGDTGVLLITHYTRILRYVKPDYVHVFVAGRIVEEGGPELAEKLEAEGYERYLTTA